LVFSVLTLQNSEVLEFK